MGFRRLFIGLAALGLGIAGSSSASAKPLTAEVANPFEAVGTIFNDAPPHRVLDFRVYLDGDNFTLRPLQSFTPSARKGIDSFGIMGIKVTPLTTYTLTTGSGPSAASDFAGAITEGCTASVAGLAYNLPTSVSRDQLYASTVDVFCPTAAA